MTQSCEGKHGLLTLKIMGIVLIGAIGIVTWVIDRYDGFAERNYKLGIDTNERVARIETHLGISKIYDANRCNIARKIE